METSNGRIEWAPVLPIGNIDWAPVLPCSLKNGDRQQHGSSRLELRASLAACDDGIQRHEYQARVGSGRVEVGGNPPPANLPSEYRAAAPETWAAVAPPASPLSAGLGVLSQPARSRGPSQGRAAGRPSPRPYTRTCTKTCPCRRPSAPGNTICARTASPICSVIDSDNKESDSSSRGKLKCWLPCHDANTERES